jgi:hypothetical protein
MTKSTNNIMKRIIYPLFFAVFVFVAGYALVQVRASRQAVKVAAYPADQGWGYKISIKDRIVIDQPFIPVVFGKKGFPDESSAYRAGRIVRMKMLRHKPPALTMEDLLSIGIDSTGHLTKAP